MQPINYGPSSVVARPRAPTTLTDKRARTVAARITWCIPACFDPLHPLRPPRPSRCERRPTVALQRLIRHATGSRPFTMPYVTAVSRADDDGGGGQGPSRHCTSSQCTAPSSSLLIRSILRR
uniref:Uncharacterized protein n=1 Tax=Plectus sambesii TaxID=2011161 RepID=A0A914WSV1_9BILA